MAENLFVMVNLIIIVGKARRANNVKFVNGYYLCINLTIADFFVSFFFSNTATIFYSTVLLVNFFFLQSVIVARYHYS